MLSTLLIVGFIGVSLFSCLTLFAACIASGRAALPHSKAVARRSLTSVNYPSIIDVQWRRLDPQLVM